MKLSNNVTLEEMLKSGTADRLGIENKYTPEALVEMIRVANLVVQPARDYFNVPMKINSGYRSVELCEAVGSSKNSNHVKGGTVDLEAYRDVSNAELMQYVVNSTPVREVIAEFWDTKDETAGWCHIQVAPMGYGGEPIFKVKDDKRNYIRMDRDEFNEFLKEYL